MTHPSDCHFEPEETMRKQFLVLVTGAALSLFTLAASAQSASDNNTAAGSTAQSSSSAPSQSSASSSDMSSPAAANGQQTIDGCIVKENTDYFIQPLLGDRRHLAGSQDLSSNVGKHVRVQGTDESTTASDAASSPSSTSASSDRTATSGSASSETQNNAAGSIAGNAGSSNASGTGPAASSGSMGKDFLVTKVEKVSESCPADIQSKIDQNKSK
jgi:hypothetical protein